MGSHAEKFYLTLGIFLLVGIVVAVAGTLAFAELGERVKKGDTQASTSRCSSGSARIIRRCSPPS